MNNKKFAPIIIALLCILSIPSVHAYAFWTYDNILKPGLVDPVASYTGIDASPDGTQGRQQGLFYTVQSWEVEFCARGYQSTGTNAADPTITTTDLGINGLYAPVTATLQARATDDQYGGGFVLYEVSWYVQTKGDAAVPFSVYLVDENNQKMYIPTPDGNEYKNVLVDPKIGASDYYAEYLNATFVKAVLEYPGGSIVGSTGLTSVNQ